jgi:uncharacterized protein YndB with AHSA1/START domain
MTTTEPTTRSVIVEKEFPHPPEKLWRALTEKSLLEQWLMKNDFEPAAGHAFTFRMDPVKGWNGVIECEVLAIEPCRVLAYTWGALGLGSVVTFTLTPTDTGTLLRMEQSGFGEHQDAAYKGAKYGWQNFMSNLERVVDGLA